MEDTQLVPLLPQIGQVRICRMLKRLFELRVEVRQIWRGASLIPLDFICDKQDEVQRGRVRSQRGMTFDGGQDVGIVDVKQSESHFF